MNPLVIVGPTSSGKTALSFAIAQKYPNVDILVVDSKQVYKEQDIVTGRDIPKYQNSSIKDQKNTRIFGVDLVNPDEQWSVAQFIDYTRQVIENSQKENRFLIIVAGTPQYFLSLIDPPATAAIPPNEELRAKLDSLSVEQLQKKVNPERLEEMNNSDRNNPRRLVRAIEIAQDTVIRPQATEQSSILTEANWIGLKVDKENLEKKIRQRVIDRIENGAIEEYKKIKDTYPNWTVEAKAAIGYQEIEQYAQGRITKEELISLWTLHEVQYAKRQMQWWKREAQINWFDPLTDQKKLLQWVDELCAN